MTSYADGLELWELTLGFELYHPESHRADEGGRLPLPRVLRAVDLGIVSAGCATNVLAPYGHHESFEASTSSPPCARHSCAAPIVPKCPAAASAGASGIRNVGGGRVCHFEDSMATAGSRRQGAAADPHSSWRWPSNRGLQLCEHDPPYGFRALCTGPDAQAGLRAIRRLRDPAKCKYKTCALVGASGTLLGARLGKSIDAHDAVLRINFAPDGPMAARTSTAPHRHLPTWIADVGARTTWRILTMEGLATCGTTRASVAAKGHGSSYVRHPAAIACRLVPLPGHGWAAAASNAYSRSLATRGVPRT